jgi:hypothetical protein
MNGVVAAVRHPLEDRSASGVGQGLEDVVGRTLHTKTITNGLWFVNIEIERKRRRRRYDADTMSSTVLRAQLSLLSLLLLCTGVLTLAAQTPAGTTLTVDGLGRGLVPLGGKWEFHTGDDPAWKSPDFDDSRWERIGADRGWGDQGHYAYSGYAWYRRHIDFRSVAGVKQHLALYTDRVYGPYEVYWNGVLIGRAGKMPPHPDFAFRPPPYSFGLGTPGAGVLAIRMWRPPPRFDDSGAIGGLDQVPLAGSAEAIAAHLGDVDHVWLRDRQFYFDVNLLYGLLAVLAFIQWLRNPGQKLLFWVALFAFSQPLHVVLFNAHIPFSQAFAFGFDLVATALKDVSLWYVLLYVLELISRATLWRWTRILAWVAVASSTLEWMAICLDWSSIHAGVYQFVAGLLNVPLVLVEGFPLVLLPFALRKRLPLANWLVAITATLLEMIGVIAVGSLLGQRFTRWHRVYEAMRYQIFAVRGNYFDGQNIATVLLLFAILYAVYRYSIEQSERQNSLEQEFKSAQEVQRILIPESLPPLPGFAVTSAYIPAQEVGGDFFQVIAQPDGSALVIVGDVSGKGLKAAMTVSLIIGSLRSIVDTFTEPAEILSRLNRRLHGRMQGGFATCVVVKLEADGRCVIANAGHPSPFVNDVEIELPGALPLGFVATAEFDDIAIQLAVGDRLTMYTDGLLEARNPAGELYGFERVQELIATQPDASGAADAAVGFGQDDDITVLTVTRLAVGVESTISLAGLASGLS